MTQPPDNSIQQDKAALRAVCLTLYPTLHSLNEVVALAESKLPITNKNDLFALLATYHNTLLYTVKEQSNQGN